MDRTVRNPIASRRGGARNQAGFLLPVVLFFAILFFAAVAMVVSQSRMHTTQLAHLTTSIRAERAAQSGIQQGLLILNKRLSYLRDRMQNGAVDANGPRLISNDDVRNYVLNLNGKNPGSFWVDWLNDITENGAAVPNQTNFTLDGDVATFSVSTPDFDLIIRLIPALNLAPVEAENTSGYNNVTLRYGYEVQATEKATDYHKTQKIRSSMRTTHVESLIQVNLARELSRYNLFAINNTTPSGTPVYDRTTYTGKVYSEQTFYTAGDPPSDPRYADSLEISTATTIPVEHKSLGTSWTPLKPDGSPAMTRVAPAPLPSSVDLDSQRQLCHRMAWGQNPMAMTFPGIYVGTAAVNGVEYDAGIYINNGTGVDEDYTSLVITPQSPTVNRYTVQRFKKSDNTAVDAARNVDQDVNVTKVFLIFSEGQLNIQGSFVNNSYVTINANNNVYITNDLQYQSGGTSPTTVLGLVAWQGDILVKRDIPPDAGSSLKNLRVHGVLMAVNGAFGAEGWENDFADYPGYKGNIIHQGAIIRKWSIATLSADLKKGWGMSTTYDPNLAFQKAPPYFPGSGRYRLIGDDSYKVVDMYVSD